MNPPSVSLSVIKVGGGLSAVPGALDRVCREVAASARDHRILVVPGGGAFADTVREFDRALGLSSDATHWMAILAMDQYAHVLAERIPGATLIEEPGALLHALPPTGVAVLAPVPDVGRRVADEAAIQPPPEDFPTDMPAPTEPVDDTPGKLWARMSRRR